MKWEALEGCESVKGHDLTYSEGVTVAAVLRIDSRRMGQKQGRVFRKPFQYFRREVMVIWIGIVAVES